MSVVADMHAAHLARLKRMGGTGHVAPRIPVIVRAPGRVPMRVAPHRELAPARILTTWDNPFGPPIPEHILVRLMLEAEQRIPIKAIVAVCAAVWGVSAVGIVSARRTRPLLNPRHAACWLAQRLTTFSLTQIGDRMDRDHTTVLHAIRRVDALIADGESEFKTKLHEAHYMLTKRSL